MFKIAARLGRTVAELEHELDYDEYLKWDAYFEHELTIHNKMDYQLAQIAMYCHMPVSDKKEFRMNDYLVKFKAKGEEAVKLPANLFCQMLKSAFGIKDK